MHPQLRNVLRLAGVEPSTLDNLEEVGKSLLGMAEGFLKPEDERPKRDDDPVHEPKRESPLKSVWAQATDSPSGTMKDKSEEFVKNFQTKNAVEEKTVGANSNEKSRLISEVVMNLEDMLETMNIVTVRDFAVGVKEIVESKGYTWIPMEPEAPVSEDYSWGVHYEDYPYRYRDAPSFQDDSWGR